MTTISASFPAPVPQRPARPSYILLSDEVLSTLPTDTQAQVRIAQDGMRRASEYATKDHTNEVRIRSKPITNQTAEQKAEIYRPKNKGAANFDSLKPTKFEANTVNLANIQNIPADQLDNRISFVTTALKKGEFKGKDFYSGNGDQLTKSPEEYLDWLKEAKASIISFEKFA